MKTERSDTLRAALEEQADGFSHDDVEEAAAVLLAQAIADGSLTRTEALARADIVGMAIKHNIAAGWHLVEARRRRQ